MAETQGNPRIQLLTDDAISNYSENNVLTDYRDINLRILTRIEPYPKGIYDQDIFGSVFYDRCNCGNIRTPGVRCPRCGSTVLDEVSSFRRFARIELPILYTTKFKIDKVIEFIRNNFNIQTNFESDKFIGLGWTDMKCLDVCQWELKDKENYTLLLTDQITDYTKCSYEGLLKILQVNYPELVKEYRAYVNQYILVIPMALRAPTIKMEGNNRVLENHYTSVIYQNILYCLDYYNSIFPTMKDEIGKSFIRGSFRRLVSSSLDTLSKLLASSKQNLARNMQSNRMNNSGRCTVVPDPTLKADEVEVPIHLMYEACRSEFIQYIQDKKGVGPKEAERIYKMDSDLDEIQNLFKDYIEGEPGKPETAKYVIINRAPSLYEFAMFSCKVKLTHDYVMKIPQVLCTPTNGDFDGDSFSFYAVPKDKNKMINDALSARNRVLYKKNQKPLFTPTHEIMSGLVKASRVIIPSNLESFDSVEEIKQYKKEHPEFKYQTLCTLKGEQTTLGREILSDLFDTNITKFVGGFDKSITGENCGLLYEQLRDKEDRLDRIRDVQEFALLIATTSGSTAIRISDLYLDIDKSYLDKIKSVEKDDKLSDQAKEFKIREIYAEFQKEQLKKIPSDVVNSIEDTFHSKVSELAEMSVQQLNTGPDHDFHITETTLASGMNSQDYLTHTIENRALQDIKALSVPQGGYVTRQFTYLASEYYFHEGSDEKNTGIDIRACDAQGRMKLDGTRVPWNEKSTDIIKVRSLVSSTLPEGVVTGDLITDKFHYKVGDKIGMSMISSLTEQLTQAGLKLKHGGKLFTIDEKHDPPLIAPEDGQMEMEDYRMIFHGKSGKDYIWPKSSMFVLDYKNDSNIYKKGDKLGQNYHPVTSAYQLDCLIKLCQARTTNSKKKFATNKKVISTCYALEDGVISYKINGDDIRVFIDEDEYNYNPDSMYIYPDGSKVKKFDRICTGTLDMKSMSWKENNYLDLFYFFRKQFLEYLDVSQELIEFLYVLLVKDRGEGNLEMRSVLQNIHGSDSFFKSLAFGDARKSFKKIGYEGMEFVADPITSIMLSMIMNNEIK